MLSILTKKVALIYLILSTLATIAATSYLTRELTLHSVQDKLDKLSIQPDNCSFRIKRLTENSMIQPILFVENSCEADNLQLLKSDINNIIASYTSKGILQSASVYLRKFISSEWIAINESEMYNPGSLLKVPELITFLKMNEEHPGILDKKLRNDLKYESERQAQHVTHAIQPGKEYTIRELLIYMIRYSDNNATFLLTRHMDAAMFKKVFTDLGLTLPNEKSGMYPMNVVDYSKFLRALFNSSYLNEEDSEFAIELLSTADFKNGILKGIPSSVKIAHKFGEEGNAQVQQLHESAIIYLEDTPYLLTIMTKGKGLNDQSSVLRDVSASVYKAFTSNPISS